MEGSVQIISRETIKPSSQIPIHNKKIKFSYIDQLLPQIYIPLIFFYQSHQSNHPHISHQLKHSLSQILPSFYPLAGRVKDNTSVLCTDAGVEFVEARAPTRLTDALHPQNMEDLKQYFPLDPSSTVGHAMAMPLVLIQLTLFDCGGFALGACVSHKVADVASAMEFFKAWSAQCRCLSDLLRAATAAAECEQPQFSFGASRHFAPCFIVSRFRLSRYFLSKQKLVQRRFVFDKEKLALLRRAATTSAASRTINDPSRVELVSAFIWKRFIEVAKTNGSKKASFAFHAINVRKRTTPPELLRNVFGNCIMASFAHVRPDQHDGFPRLIEKLRKSIRKVRDDYVMKPLSRKSAMKDLLRVGLQIVTGKLEWCLFTSWRGFDAYGVDYGWGKPVWFSTVAMPVKNVVVLVDSGSGDAVEAIVSASGDVVAEIEYQMRLISVNV